MFNPFKQAQSKKVEDDKKLNIGSSGPAVNALRQKTIRNSDANLQNISKTTVRPSEFVETNSSLNKFSKTESQIDFAKNEQKSTYEIQSDDARLSAPQTLKNDFPEMKEGNKSPVSITMLSAIEQKAGKNTADKWKKKLDTKKANLNMPQPKKGTPEFYLEKQEKQGQSKKQIKNASQDSALIKTAKKDILKPKGAVITKRTGTVRTFKSDLQSLMQNEKLSLTKIVAIESDKRRYTKTKLKKKTEGRYSIMASTVLLVAIVLTGSLFAYAVYLQNKSGDSSQIDTLADNQSSSLSNDLLFIEDKTRIDISGKTRIYIIRVLQAARDSKSINSMAGNVVEFELVKKLGNLYKKISARDFLKMVYPNAPDTFVESIKPTYMTGVHVSKNGRDPFIIFTTDSYQYAFAAMLNWEKTMVDNIGVFLASPYRNDFTGYLSDKPKFKDASLKNYSVRVLYSASGKVVLLYGFLYQDTIIITDNPKTFLELANRINIERNR